MISFLVRKLIWAAATLAVASVLVFATLEIVPGDPAQVILGINATDYAIESLRADL
jgi:peptide/nickel transport system permease protein